MKKSEIRKLAVQLARQKQSSRLPNGDFPDHEFGNEWAVQISKKIRAATTRNKVQNLIAKEQA